MILVKLRDGLSNQMFQYAAARRLAAVHGTSVRIDTSWYDNIPAGVTQRSYELDKLRITGTQASRWETIGTDGVRHSPLYEVPVALFRKIRPRYRFVGERHFHFDSQILDLSDNVCLFGYWVSEKYFLDADEIVRREYMLRSLPSAENERWLGRLRESESVALHVRRGDYVSNPANSEAQGTCDPDYYRRCIASMRRRLHDPVFFVFSDDLNWARDNLPLSGDTDYVDHNSGKQSCEDLRLMSSAQHNIIANSGFSWWGAWLNSNKGKVVIGPRRWMKDPTYQTHDVLPADWISM